MAVRLFLKFYTLVDDCAFVGRNCFVNLSLSRPHCLKVNFFFFPKSSQLLSLWMSCVSFSKWERKKEKKDWKAAMNLNVVLMLFGWLEIVITAFARVNTTPTIFGSTRERRRKILFFFFFFSKLARMKGRGIKSMVTIILWLAMIGVGNYYLHYNRWDGRRNSYVRSITLEGKTRKKRTKKKEKHSSQIFQRHLGEKERSESMIKWWPQRYYFSSRNKLFTETRNKLFFFFSFYRIACVCVGFKTKNCNIWKGGVWGVRACWSRRTSKNKSAICSIDCQLCHQGGKKNCKLNFLLLL